MNEKKLKARDFITIGIFTAILWVVQMIIMYLGFLSPFVVAGYSVLIPIVTGIPMMLYYARIEKFGMLTITSIIVAILLFIFGMGFLGAPICIVSGIIADLIAKSGKYKSWKKTVISCGVFNLWVSASYLPLVFTADSYQQSLLEGGYDAAFVDTLFTLVTPATYPVIIMRRSRTNWNRLLPAIRPALTSSTRTPTVPTSSWPWQKSTRIFPS